MNRDSLADHFNDGRRSRLAGCYVDAERSLRAALMSARSAMPPDDESLGWILNELGIVHRYSGRFDAAHESYMAALRSVARAAPRGINTQQLRATVCHNLGGLENARGEYAAAQLWADQGVQLRTEALGPDHLHVAFDRAAQAPILLELGRLGEAESILHQVLTTYLRTYGETHHEVAVTLHNLATCVYRRGEMTAAKKLLQRAVEMKRTVLGRDHPELAVSLANCGHVHEELGELAEARSAYRDAVTILQGRVEDVHPVLVACRNRLGHIGSPATVGG